MHKAGGRSRPGTTLNSTSVQRLRTKSDSSTTTRLKVRMSPNTISGAMWTTSSKSVSGTRINSTILRIQVEKISLGRPSKPRHFANTHTHLNSYHGHDGHQPWREGPIYWAQSFLLYDSRKGPENALVRHNACLDRLRDEAGLDRVHRNHDAEYRTQRESDMKHGRAW